jgi:hypothetical protein
MLRLRTGVPSFTADKEPRPTASDEQDARIGPAEPTTGDALRIAGGTRLKLSGAGELFLWDVPHVRDDAND